MSLIVMLGCRNEEAASTESVLEMKTIDSRDQVAAAGVDEGWRDTAWGSPPDESMVFVKAEGTVKFFEKPYERFSIGEITLGNIKYGYWENQLYKVTMNLMGSEECRPLWLWMTSQYGEPIDTGRDNTFGSWEGYKSGIILFGISSCEVTYFHIDLSQKQRAAK